MSAAPAGVDHLATEEGLPMLVVYRRLIAAIALAVVALTASTPARAQEAAFQALPEFSLGIGYANVTLEGSPVIDNESGIRFDPTLSFAPIGEALPQLRLGVAVGFTLVLDNSSRTLISKDGQLLFFGSSDIPLWLVEPELRVSWRQWFGDTWFIEGGVGGGIAIGTLQLDATEPGGDSYEESDSTPFGRAFLRAGARVTGGSAGVEGWWLVGDTLDFGGNASGDLTEWYVGVFGALSF
jgi:hypothetical protein